MILESSLQKLRSRGYNVGRILHQKATEARIAEEARIAQLEDEQREIRDRESAWKELQAANSAKTQKQNGMPGFFPVSPDDKRADVRSLTRPVEEEPIMDRPRGFFSGIGKQFGFDKVQRQLSQTAAAGRSSIKGLEAQPADAPPPYSQNDKQKSQTHIPQPETVTAPHHLQQK